MNIATSFNSKQNLCLYKYSDNFISPLQLKYRIWSHCFSATACSTTHSHRIWRNLRLSFPHNFQLPPLNIGYISNRRCLQVRKRAIENPEQSCLVNVRVLKFLICPQLLFSRCQRILKQCIIQTQLHGFRML